MLAPAQRFAPEWPAPANVRAACSTRAGGVSRPPYDALNLGDHVGDDLVAVETNRNIYRDTLGARPVFLSQVHGRDVATLSLATPDRTQADACVTFEAGVACTIMVADCLPVLITTEDGRAVAAAHAGWRGLAGEGGQGVLEAVVSRLEAEPSVPASELLVWLGPCIGPKAFEVGAEVKLAFEDHDAGASPHFRAHGDGKWLADLSGLARQRLRSLGIRQIYGNDGTPAWCTVGNPSRFFSYRRDSITGRFASSIWRV